MDHPEPWYGVRLLFRHRQPGGQAYEERILIVRAESHAEAILKAECDAEDYESDTTEYIRFADSFHIFDERGPCLGHGVEVFSLIRKSDLEPDAYLTRYFDTGEERSERIHDE
jgi:hypothetical protein